MGTFLFLLLLFFIIIPIVRVIYAVYVMRKRARDFMRQAQEATDGFFGGSQSNARNQQPPAKPKKIGKDVGEYVAFEEVEISQTTVSEDGSRTETTHIEQQIVDAEWEEV